MKRLEQPLCGIESLVGKTPQDFSPFCLVGTAWFSGGECAKGAHTCTWLGTSIKRNTAQPAGAQWTCVRALQRRYNSYAVSRTLSYACRFPLCQIIRKKGSVASGCVACIRTGVVTCEIHPWLLVYAVSVVREINGLHGEWKLAGACRSSRLGCRHRHKSTGDQQPRSRNTRLSRTRCHFFSRKRA